VFSAARASASSSRNQERRIEPLVVADRDARSREQVLGPRDGLLDQLVGIVERARPRQRRHALGRRCPGHAIRVQLLAALEERALERRQIDVVRGQEPEQRKRVVAAYA
jgi:hypothetical protein